MRTPLLSTAGLVLLTAVPPTAQANCTFAADSGDDAYLCDSGSAPSLTDLTGNNTLILPAAGTGTITGNVVFGPGQDRVDIHSGSVLGNIQQGSGIDTFVMSGGQLGSLNQGDARDIFEMNGGHIIGAFEDGDVARMSGGRIGRVDMKLDNNLFDMSGGRIDGNLVAGFGNDTIILSNGSIGGNISVSGGNDSLTLTGGQVGGNVLLSFGNDSLLWQGGGTILGVVQMGEGDDQAQLSGLSEAQLGTTRLINGDLGNDTLTFSNTQTTSGARYTGWESVSLSNGSRFDLDDSLVLGDSASATGVLGIDASSSLVSRSGSIIAADASANATLDNAGLINLGRGGDARGRLNLAGDYVGNNGRLHLNSVLGADDSASDRLVVSRGSLSGTTSLQVSNLGGAGAQTRANGIQVIEALDGATSSANAFRLGNTVSAGAYEYYLFKGGVTAGSENHWYLRSTVAAAGEGPAPTPAPGTPALPSALAGQTIVLYRPEVAVYAVANRAAGLLARSTLSTFHERQGEQGLLQEQGVAAAGWSRAFGGRTRQQWSGTVAPNLDASVRGFQVGHDVFASRSDEGVRQHAGVYLSRARLSGDVKGFALGFEDNAVGDVRVDGDSLGAYWTLIGPQRWYVDSVLQYTDLDGRARSDRGVKIDLRGHVLTGSVESGYPLPLGERWSLEPQVQVIAQRIALRSDDDGISRVEQDSQTNWTGRLGLRLTGNALLGDVPLTPYLRVDSWRSFGGRDTLSFAGGDPIKTDQAARWFDVGAGVTARLSPSLSVYTGVTYSNNLGSRQLEQVSGNLGLRLSW